MSASQDLRLTAYHEEAGDEHRRVVRVYPPREPEQPGDGDVVQEPYRDRGHEQRVDLQHAAGARSGIHRNTLPAKWR